MTYLQGLGCLDQVLPSDGPLLRLLLGPPRQVLLPTQMVRVLALLWPRLDGVSALERHTCSSTSTLVSSQGLVKALDTCASYEYGIHVPTLRGRASLDRGGWAEKDCVKYSDASSSAEPFL